VQVQLLVPRRLRRLQQGSPLRPSAGPPFRPVPPPRVAAPPAALAAGGAVAGVAAGGGNAFRRHSGVLQAQVLLQTGAGEPRWGGQEQGAGEALTRSPRDRGWGRSWRFCGEWRRRWGRRKGGTPGGRPPEAGPRPTAGRERSRSPGWPRGLQPRRGRCATLPSPTAQP